MSEQSVLTNGYSSIIVNNTLRHEELLDRLPSTWRPITIVFLLYTLANTFTSCISITSWARLQTL